MAKTNWLNWKWITLAISIIFVIIIIALSIVTVAPGHIGLIKRAGRIRENILTAGVHGKAPFVDSVIRVDKRMQTVSFSSIAFSNDIQNIHTQATLQWSIEPSLMPKAYTSIGDRDMIKHNIIQQAISNSLKAIITNYSAVELVTKRSEVKSAIFDAIDKFIIDSLEDKNLVGLIIIDNMALTDFKFSEEFNKAIENKVKTEQEALQAKNEKEKLITQAEAQAQQIKLSADAAAYEKEANAQAEANQISLLAAAEADRVKLMAEANSIAIQKEADALNGREEFIRYKQVNRWNGKLPVMTGNGQIPMVDVNNLIEHDSL